MVNVDDVLNEMNKKKKEQIISNHKYKISQMKGKDHRWATYVPDESKANHRRFVAKSSKEDLIDFLCDFYESGTGSSPLCNQPNTLESLYPEWLEYKKLHTTAISYINRIQSDWRTYYMNTDIIKLPLSSLTKLELDKWAHSMIKKYEMTRKCYNNVQMIMRQSLDYAVDIGIIDYNPMHQIKVDRKMFRREKKKPDATQVYTPEELASIEDLAWKDFYAEVKDYRLAPLALIFQYQTGVRIGELVALRYEDIEEDHYIHVQRMYRRDARQVVEHTKTDDGDRFIYLTEKARKIIAAAKDYQEKHGYDTDGFIFALNDHIIPQRSINTLLIKYCKILDIPYRSSHKNRKSYGSALLNNGMSINTVRQILGHSDEKTTLKFYCFDQSLSHEKEEIIERALGR